jgi:hypothetical protein
MMREPVSRPIVAVGQVSAKQVKNGPVVAVVWLSELTGFAPGKNTSDTWQVFINKYTYLGPTGEYATPHIVIPAFNDCVRFDRCSIRAAHNTFKIYVAA